MSSRALPGADAWIPEKATLPVLKDAVQECRGCDLYKQATQAVFGEGRKTASILFIGEQPGDEEDKKGRPFVGPAVRLFDRALQEAGIERDETYVTNAVKHFKFEERGKRRIHKKPSGPEVRACRPWLESEIAVVRPAIIVCLGATAAQSIFGAAYRVTKQRGQIVAHPLARHATSTVHPSAILRAPDEAARHAEYNSFVADLVRVKEFAESVSRSGLASSGNL